MCFTYVLFSKGFGRCYVGISDDVDKRMVEHNSGKTKSTKAFVPWHLVHIEAYSSKVEARKREKYLKSAAGRRWRKKNIDLGD